MNKFVTGIVIWNVAEEAVNRFAEKLKIKADAEFGVQL